MKSSKLEIPPKLQPLHTCVQVMGGTSSELIKGQRTECYWGSKECSFVNLYHLCCNLCMHDPAQHVSH